jgi:hypothetical protein
MAAAAAGHRTPGHSIRMERRLTIIAVAAAALLAG